MEQAFLTENVQEHIITIKHLVKNAESYNALTEIEKLEKIKSYYTKLVSGITSEISHAKNQLLKSNAGGGNSSKLVITFSDTSFVEPRGRLEVSFYNHGLSFEGKVLTAFINWSDISNLIRIPNSMSTKKEGEEILIIRLSKPLTIGSKEHRHFLWNLSNTPSKADSTIESEIVLNQISICSKLKLHSIKKSIFQSILNQKSFLRCYKGTQEGAIYPLKCKQNIKKLPPSSSCDSF